MALDSRRLSRDEIHSRAVRTSPELVFGLVGAIGSDLKKVSDSLADALAREVAYTAMPIRLSHLLHEVEGIGDLSTEGDKYSYYKKHMASGTELRRKLKAADAMALLAITAIRERRDQMLASEPPIARRAFILHSLKREEEISTLRRLYGPAFFLVSVYAPREIRVEVLAQTIAQSRGQWRGSDCRSEAEDLIRIDEKQFEEPLGQDVQKAFPEGDVFIDASNPEQMRNSVRRFVRLVFGDPFLTPTRDEYGIFFAKAAALRSSALGRQVGSAICTEAGDLVAVGTNEVPKAGGGLYWEGDHPDGRDFVSGYDKSDRHKRDLVREILGRLKNAGWLASEFAAQAPEDLCQRALAKDATSVGPLRDSRLMNLIEFMRPVHAEMAALMDAARYGRPVQGTIVFVTTFPCHECARHLISAGVSRVAYIDPYPKSLASELYGDSMEMEGTATSGTGRRIAFVPFVGIAPRKYLSFFELRGERKSKDGSTVPWEPGKVEPKESGDYSNYAGNEAAFILKFEKSAGDVGLRFKTSG